MPQQTLKQKLHLFDFETDTPHSGLLFTNRKYKDTLFDEILVLDQASKLGASAVYFRRIDGQTPVPQIFIFDNSQNNFSIEKLADIHKKLWSSGIVPLYYVFDKIEVKIFNCRKPVERKTLEPKVMDKLSLVSEAHENYKKYSAEVFRNGSFWETEKNRDQFKANNSSNNKLIDELRRIRKKFAGTQNEEVYNKLLVLSILVKYLEERKDRNGNPAALKPEYFNKYGNASCFCDVLRKNKCVELFESLSKEVNGEIFALRDNEKAN